MKTNHLRLLVTVAASTLLPCWCATMKTLGLLFLMGSLASCSSSSNPDSKTSPVAFQPNHWHKVRSNPPTYFPKGVPADHPTRFSDGSWVFTGDKADTRYFIPAGGVASKNLITEAMATMTPNRRKEVNKGGGVDLQIGELVQGGLLGFGQALLEVDDHITRTTGRAPKGGANYNARDQLEASR
jgi:hypothetical protein